MTRDRNGLPIEPTISKADVVSTLEDVCNDLECLMDDVAEVDTKLEARIEAAKNELEDIRKTLI